MASDAREQRFGHIQQKDYENEWYYSKLEPVLKQLQQDVPDAKYDKRSLATLIWQLLQFMEDYLGRTALPPKPFPKLPMSLFENFAPDGPLYIIASKCAQVRKERDIKKIEFNQPSKRKECSEILAYLRRELVKQQIIKSPVVLIHPSVPADQQQRLRVGPSSLL